MTWTSFSSKHFGINSAPLFRPNRSCSVTADFSLYLSSDTMKDVGETKPPALGKASSSFRLRNESLDILRLRRIFDLFDHNKDGEITDDELCQVLNQLGLEADQTEITSTVSTYLKPGRTGLDFDDFYRLHRSIGDSLFGDFNDEDSDRGDEEDLKEAFRVFDTNDDGLISAMELQEVLMKLGLPEGGEIRRVENMIFSVDRNNDGSVDFDEFKIMMRSISVKGD